MSKNDFLYALKEELPQDFSDNLRQQLEPIEHISIIKKTTDSKNQRTNKNLSIWILAVATIATVFFGIVFFVSNSRNQDVLNIAQLPPTLTEHGEITPETASQIQSITTLGYGFPREIHLSPDGEVLLVEASSGIYLHDANNLNAEPSQLMIDDRFHLIAFAEDGSLYGTYPNDERNGFQIVQVRLDGEITYLFDLDVSNVSRFDMTSDGSRLFVQVCLEENYVNGYCPTMNYTTRIYDTQTGTIGAEFSSVQSPDYSFFTINYFGTYFDNSKSDLSQDGNQYVYMAYENEAYVIYHMDVQTGQAQAVLRFSSERDFGSTEWIKLSPDGQTLLVNQYNEVRSWDLGDLLVDDTILTIGEDTPEQSVRLGMGNVAIFHPDNQTLIGITQQSFYTYSLNEDNADVDFDSNLAGLSLMNAPQIHPDGDSIYAVLTSGELQRYNILDDTLEDSSYRYDGGSQNQFFFRDDTRLMTISNSPSSFRAAYLREWSLDTDNPTSSLFLPDGEIPYPLAAEIAISEDGRYLSYAGRASMEIDGGLRWLHDLTTGERYLMTNFSADKGILFTPDNRLIGLGANLGYIHTIDEIITSQDTATEYETFYLERDYSIPFWSWLGNNLALSLDGTSMVTIPCSIYAYGSQNEPCNPEIVFWDIQAGEAIYSLQLDWVDLVPQSLAFSLESQTVAVSACADTDEPVDTTCNNVSFYDVSQLPLNDTGNIIEQDITAIASIDNLVHDVYSIVFQPNRSQDEHQIIALSDANSLTTLIQITNDGTIEQLTTLPVGGNVAFSPDGNLIFTTNQHGQIEIWGVPNNEAESEKAPPAVPNLNSGEIITADNIANAEIVAELGDGHASHIALSPDDETLAITTNTGIFLHDAHDLNAASQAIGKPAETEHIQHLEYSDSGDLHVVTYDYLNNSLVLYRWDAETEQFIALYGGSARNQDSYVAFQKFDLSPDGNQLLIARCIAENGITFVQSRPLCVYPASAEIEIIDLQTLENSIEINLSNTSNAIAAMSPDWTQLAYYDDGFVYLYDMATGETQSFIEVNIASSQYTQGASMVMFALYFSLDSQELGILNLTNSQYNSWNIEDMLRLDSEAPIVRQSYASPFAETLASFIVFNPITNERVTNRSDSLIINSDDNAGIAEFASIHEPRAVHISSDGQQVYGLSRTGSIKVWNWESRSSIASITAYSLESSMLLSFSANSELFINHSRWSRGSMSFLWEIANTEIEHTTLLPEDHAAFPITLAALSQDSRYVAYIQEYQLYVYDRDAQEHRHLDTLFSPLTLGFHENGSLFVMTVEQGYGTIKTYSPEMLASADIPYPYVGEVVSGMLFSGSFNTRNYSLSGTYAISPDAETFVSYRCGAMIDATFMSPSCEAIHIELIDMPTADIFAELETNLTEDGIFQQIVFSPDGNYIAMAYCSDVGDDNSWECEENKGAVDIWHVEDILAGELAPLMTIRDLPFRQMQITLLPNSNGSFLLATTNWELEEATAINKQVTRFWSVQLDSSREEIHQLQSSTVTFSPNGQLMLTNNDSQIQVWAVLDN